MDELPYHYHQLNPGQLESSPYLTDMRWIYHKVCGSNCFQLLEDVHLAGVKDSRFLQVLKDFLETSASYLNYDGRQFYAQLRCHLDERIGIGEYSLDELPVKDLYELTKSPPVLSIVPVQNLADTQNDKPSGIHKEKCFNLVTRLVGNDRFVVSIATDKEEIAVWDVKK